MRVTVVGSYRGSVSTRNKETEKETKAKFAKFEQACVGIGRVLADGGHRLFVAHGERLDSAEALALKGLRKQKSVAFEQVPQHAGVTELKPHLDAVESSDVVVLIGGGNGTYASGLSALRRRKLMIPIPVFGGSARDLCEIPEIDRVVDDRIRNLDLESSDWIVTLTGAIESVLARYPSVLIIHGRGDNGEELRSRISTESNQRKRSEPGKTLSGIDAPEIMSLTGSGAVTVPQVFEDLASQVSAAIVIVTADDIGGFARDAKDEAMPATALHLEVRARENVWVEVGWFWGRLGRERILLWLKDKVQLPSDLQGVARTEAATLDDAWPSIEQFLKRMRGL